MKFVVIFILLFSWCLIRAQVPNNIDFNDGSINGWHLGQCHNNNSQSFAASGCSGLPDYSIIDSAYVDPNVAISAPSPLGGYFLRLNNMNTGGIVGICQQDFIVPPGVTQIIYCYALVFEKSPNPCSGQPYFFAGLIDTISHSSPIINSSYYSNPIYGSCSSGDVSLVTSGNYMFKNWTIDTIDVSAFSGLRISFEFRASGDIYASGANAGYAYIDIAPLQGIATNLIDNASSSNFSLSPNPNDGQMSLTYQIKQASELIITDVSGREVFKQLLLPQEHHISIYSNLNHGLYFYSVLQNGTYIKTGKVMIVK